MHCCLYLEILKNVLFEIVFPAVQWNKGAPAWAGMMHQAAARAGGCGPAVACAHVWDQAWEQKRRHNHASGHSWHRSPRQTAQPVCCNRRGSSKSGKGTRRKQGSEWQGGSSRDCDGKPLAPAWPTASAQVLTLDWAPGRELLSLGQQILPVKLL